MITYVANYEPGNKPYICKVLTAASGEEFHVALNYSNESEREEMSAELIYQHLENCVTYMEDKSKEIKVIAIDEPVGKEPWPAKGWSELLWANEEIILWWSYIYYKREDSVPESSPVEVGLEIGTSPEIYEDGEAHTHEDGETHTHA